MKSGYRNRKLILEAIKQEPAKQTTQSRNIETPSRFPPNRIILRNSKKVEADSHYIPSHQLKSQKLLTGQNEFQAEDNSQQAFPIIQTRHQQQQVKTPQEFLQARDRRTLLKYDFVDKKFQLDRERDALNEWLGEMHFKVVSSSFNLYLSNELTFQQVKVHCCENLLLNILNFLQNLTEKQLANQNSQSLASSLLRRSKIKIQSLGYLELTQILKQINDTLIKNLAYMQIKYPLTKDTKPNKVLQSLISKINNLGNDEHDMVMKSGVDFKLKHQDNYTPQIMKFLNFIITKQSETCKIKGRNNKDLTYFQYFYETMETIFTSVYKPEYQTKEKVQKNNQEGKQDKQGLEAVNLFAQIFSGKGRDKDEVQQQIQSKQAKQYKQKVMKYTHYLIGRKISANTELYSEKQILTQIFDVRNSSILRILTKWTQQLESKIDNAEQNILKRPFRFKKNTPYEYSKLSANQKNDLYQQTKLRAKDVKNFNEELRQNYNQIESMLCSHLDQPEKMKNIPKNQYKVGYFCSKIQVAASSTLLSYLNKMIHILLMIPEQLKKNHQHDEQYLQNIDINLITFKIADLFRCKIKSREAQIVRILKQLKKISEKGQPFKIIRMKDRLNLGTRDILINVLFMNIFLCEIQLAVEEYVDAKQLSYDSFSHFLYQLHRSRLGPVMQSACTWAQFDQRSKIYRNLLNDRSHEICKYVPHHCGKQYLISNNYPFVCSLCQKFYSNQEGLLQHLKCNLCRTFFQCSVCRFTKMTPIQIANLIHLPKKVGMFLNEFELWTFVDGVTIQFPKFGLLTSKKMKKPEIIFFQTIIFRFDEYLIKIIEDKNEQQNTRVEIIEKIQGSSPKGWKILSQKYIIYNWKEKRSINKTITPQLMLQAMDQQKKKRQEALNARKQQKQRKRLQLEEKRRKDKDDDEEDDEKKKKKKKKEENQDDNQSKASKVNGKKEFDDDFSKPIVYHEGVCKKNEILKVRVIEKAAQMKIDILVLGIYLKESIIRNKLKQMNNSNILQKISLQKIEVLFFQDEYIHDELNEESRLTELQLGQLKQTLQRVSQVYLDNNYILSIDFLAKMNSLKVAHMSHNKIYDLSPLQNLNHLTELILENNTISQLDDGLKNKPCMLEINLNRNQLSSLQFFRTCQQGDFGHLKVLSVNSNQISSLQGLQRLKSLVKLDLSYNEIQEIGKIQTLINLEQLDLSNNKFKKVKGLEQFSNLKKLYLNDNKIRKIPQKIKQLIFLNNLDLNSNKIQKIQNLNSGAISKSLKMLNLGDNLIRIMEGLEGMENLQVLNLSHNQIQTIDNYLDLSSLTKLYLDHNCIQQIDLQDTQKYLPSLRQLYLNSNPIKDNQSNKKMQATLMKHIKIVKINMKIDNVWE